MKSAKRKVRVTRKAGHLIITSIREVLEQLTHPQFAHSDCCYIHRYLQEEDDDYCQYSLHWLPTPAECQRAIAKAEGRYGKQAIFSADRFLAKYLDYTYPPSTRRRNDLLNSG